MTLQLPSKKYFEHYYLENDLGKLVSEYEQSTDEEMSQAVDPLNKKPFRPQRLDLAFLHAIIRKFNVLTVLEFGVGCSTIVMADSLRINHAKFAEKLADFNVRREAPFKVHAIDNYPEFIQLTKSRVPENLKEFICFSESKVIMSNFLGRMSTHYEKLPRVSPDLIYLDAPSQYGVIETDYYSTSFPDSMPMSDDILRIEHFLLPGTIIVVDGRTANVRFIKANLQRHWVYCKPKGIDFHVFYLAEADLGSVSGNYTDLKWAEL